MGYRPDQTNHACQDYCSLYVIWKVFPIHKGREILVELKEIWHEARARVAHNKKFNTFNEMKSIKKRSFGSRLYTDYPIAVCIAGMHYCNYQQNNKLANRRDLHEYQVSRTYRFKFFRKGLSGGQVNNCKQRSSRREMNEVKLWHGDCNSKEQQGAYRGQTQFKF